MPWRFVYRKKEELLWYQEPFPLGSLHCWVVPKNSGKEVQTAFFLGGHPSPLGNEAGFWDLLPSSCLVRELFCKSGFGVGWSSIEQTTERRCQFIWVWPPGSSWRLLCFCLLDTAARESVPHMGHQLCWVCSEDGNKSFGMCNLSTLGWNFNPGTKEKWLL